MIFVLVIIFLVDFLNVYVGIFPLSRTLPNSGKSINEEIFRLGQFSVSSDSLFLLLVRFFWFLSGGRHHYPHCRHVVIQIKVRHVRLCFS